MEKERNGNSSESALNAKSKKSEKKGKPMSEIECFNCHKKGHKKATCYAKGGDMEGQGSRQKKKDEKANVVADVNSKTDKAEPKTGNSESTSNAQEFSFLAQMALAVTSDDKIRICMVVEPERCSVMKPDVSADGALDSGSTSHYCNTQERFITYQKIDPKEVLVADGRRIDAIGIGEVRINTTGNSFCLTAELAKNIPW